MQPAAPGVAGPGEEAGADVRPAGSDSLCACPGWGPAQEIPPGRLPSPESVSQGLITSRKGFRGLMGCPKVHPLHPTHTCCIGPTTGLSGRADHTLMAP